MPALDTISTACPVCGNGRLYPGRYPERPLEINVEGGVKYPDILGCGSYPFLIVSDAVVTDWITHSVSGFTSYPLRVAAAKGPNIRDVPKPQYHHIQVTGRCEVDLRRMRVKLTYRCPVCDYRDFKAPMHFPYTLRDSAPLSTDLAVSDEFPTVYFCSQRVFDLAGLFERTNFRFVPLSETKDPLRDGDDYVRAARQKFGTAREKRN